MHAKSIDSLVLLYQMNPGLRQGFNGKSTALQRVLMRQTEKTASQKDQTGNRDQFWLTDVDHEPIAFLVFPPFRFGFSSLRRTRIAPPSSRSRSKALVLITSSFNFWNP